MTSGTLQPTTWVAVALVIVAGLAIVIEIATAKFDNWAPNIATEALSIAMTILIGERIVQRENRRRIAAWREYMTPPLDLS